MDENNPKPEADLDKANQITDSDQLNDQQANHDQSTEPHEHTQDEQPLGLSKDKPKIDLSQPFSWQATELAQTNRSLNWYIVFALIMLGLMAISLFVFKDYIFAILIPIMTTAVILVLRKPSRIINYSVTPKGVYVADKLYDFSEFRYFGLVQSADQTHILLVPTKRFGVGVTLYFDNKDGETIVDMLGARIPMQQIKKNFLEKIISFTKLQ